jgi:branched-chain amino acid transport system permease protein
MGLLAIRRQGIYFSMITLALAQMVYFAALRAPFTHGEDGLQGVPRGTLLGARPGNDLVLYYVVLAIFVAGFALIVRTVHSPFGQVLKAIKENEPRAISLGYDVDRYKLLAFVLSAALAGLAGATKTLVLSFETLTDVHWTMSGLVILMTLVGGMGTLVGPIVGAFLIVALENKLGDLGSRRLAGGVTHIEWFSTLGESVGHGDRPGVRRLRAAVPPRHRGRDHRRHRVHRLRGRRQRPPERDPDGAGAGPLRSPESVHRDGRFERLTRRLRRDRHLG